ncbi:MAG: hypothetical protein D6805_02140 [Planctomycetota bacterium]|nr:MAG: hypothetical protein D6805_02140 [Planctomycetota bacterium]
MVLFFLKMAYFLLKKSAHIYGVFSYSLALGRRVGMGRKRMRENPLFPYNLRLVFSLYGRERVCIYKSPHPGWGSINAKKKIFIKVK